MKSSTDKYIIDDAQILFHVMYRDYKFPLGRKTESVMEGRRTSHVIAEGLGCGTSKVEAARLVLQDPEATQRVIDGETLLLAEAARIRARMREVQAVEKMRAIRRNLAAADSLMKLAQSVVRAYDHIVGEEAEAAIAALRREISGKIR